MVHHQHFIAKKNKITIERMNKKESDDDDKFPNILWEAGVLSNPI